MCFLLTPRWQFCLWIPEIWNSYPLTSRAPVHSSLQNQSIVSRNKERRLRTGGIEGSWYHWCFQAFFHANISSVRYAPSLLSPDRPGNAVILSYQRPEAEDKCSFSQGHRASCWWSCFASSIPLPRFMFELFHASAHLEEQNTWVQNNKIYLFYKTKNLPHHKAYHDARKQW